MSSGAADGPQACHLGNARNHGVTREEIAAALAHAAPAMGTAGRGLLPAGRCRPVGQPGSALVT